MLSNVPVVRAGDVLLVCFDRLQTEEETRRFREWTEEYLPGVRVAFAEGVSGLAVFRPGTHDDSACRVPTTTVDRGEQG